MSGLCSAAAPLVAHPSRAVKNCGGFVPFKVAVANRKCPRRGGRGSPRPSAHARRQVPLDARYDGVVPDENRWSPAMLFQACPDIGLVVDLTKTDRCRHGPGGEMAGSAAV